jgi:hypothetical protein
MKNDEKLFRGSDLTAKPAKMGQKGLRPPGIAPDIMWLGAKCPPCEVTVQSADSIVK